MTIDEQREPPAGRYADLLGPGVGTDPELARLIADLDTYYAAEVPADLATAFDATLAQRRHDTSALPAAGAVAPDARRIERSTRPIQGDVTMRARRLSTIIGTIAAVLVVGLLVAVLIGSHGGGTSPQPGSGETPSQHFARAGGVQIVLQVQNCPANSSPANCSVDTNMRNFLQAERQRAADVLGVKDAIVTNAKGDFVEIDLPGDTDAAGAAAILSSRDMFDVIDTNGGSLPIGTDVSGELCAAGVPCLSTNYRILFTGDQIDPNSIQVGIDSTSGQPHVSFAFAGAARDQFATYTAQHIGGALTIVVAGKVVESAMIQSAITGSVQITNFSSVAAAQNLGSLLKLGPPPLPLSATVLSATVVGPNNSCVTPVPGTPPVYPGTATPAPNATDTPKPPATPPPTPTSTISGQSANFAPVYSGGPSPIATCGTPIPTPTVSDHAPTPTILPTPTEMPAAGTPTDTPPATATPKP